MKKKVVAALLAATMAAFTLAGCSSGSNAPAASSAAPSSSAAASSEAPASEAPASEAPAEKEDVTLTVWGAEEDQTMLGEMIDAFKEANADVANWNITLGVNSESTAKDTILTDIEAAADVFAFADDQINALVDAGALQPITLDADKIKSENVAGSVEAATVNDQLYAYPMTSDNGYFMFYNKAYISDEQVKQLDTILEAAQTAGKKFTFDFSSGWYIYSFFKGAGLELGLEPDGLTNYCNWNDASGKYKGTDVVESLLALCADPGFVSLGDAEFAAGVTDGSIVAGVNGTWNAAVAQEAWGDDYAATKLPTYTLAGDQVQMSSFAGYKLIGVNAYSDYAGYAMMLGEWLTNYDNQVKRFQERGLGPSNIEAAASPDVQADPAIAALAAQGAYATVQRVGGNYWTPAQSFGAIMVAGNPDGTDPQVLLDNMVEGITAPAAQ
jgi:arabinogalactan oligomer/maltooligosaccharide transport system substrate-binding protein